MTASLTKTRYHSFLFLSSCVENTWSPFLLQAQLIVRTRTLKCWLRLFHDFASKTTVFQDLNLPRSLFIHRPRTLSLPWFRGFNTFAALPPALEARQWGPFFVFVLFVSFHYSCWFYNYIITLCFGRFEFNSRCTTKVGTNKLVKPEYFQDQREAPEKAAAQRWIHKTHK